MTKLNNLTQIQLYPNKRIDQSQVKRHVSVQSFHLNTAKVKSEQPDNQAYKQMKDKLESERF